VSSLLNPKGHTTLKVGQVISQTRIDCCIILLTWLSKSQSKVSGNHTVIINHLYCNLSLANFDLECLYTHQLQLLPPGRKLWKFLVLRDNWLVTNKKVNLQLDNDSLVAITAMSHRPLFSKEDNESINEANMASFSKPNVVKSIPLLDNHTYSTRCYI
jgi:hypothetical protein